jgi:hypothetical protein
MSINLYPLSVKQPILQARFGYRSTIAPPDPHWLKTWLKLDPQERERLELKVREDLKAVEHIDKQTGPLSKALVFREILREYTANPKLKVLLDSGCIPSRDCILNTWISFLVTFPHGTRKAADRHLRKLEKEGLIGRTHTLCIPAPPPRGLDFPDDGTAIYLTPLGEKFLDRPNVSELPPSHNRLVTALRSLVGVTGVYGVRSSLSE